MNDEIKELKEALYFYANSGNWEERVVHRIESMEYYDSTAGMDRGNVARKALDMEEPRK